MFNLEISIESSFPFHHFHLPLVIMLYSSPNPPVASIYWYLDISFSRPPPSSHNYCCYHTQTFPPSQQKCLLFIWKALLEVRGGGGKLVLCPAIEPCQNNKLIRYQLGHFLRLGAVRRQTR